MIISSTPYDTPEIAALRERVNAQERDFRQLERDHHRREQELAAEYADLMLKLRPQYPTPEHLRALEQVAHFVHEGIEYGDHLGYPTSRDRENAVVLPRGVHFSSQYSRINVHALAPYAPRTARLLWKFTEDEVSALRDRLAGLSLGIASEWIHEDGVAFVVRSRRV